MRRLKPDPLNLLVNTDVGKHNRSNRRIRENGNADIYLTDLAFTLRLSVFFCFDKSSKQERSHRRELLLKIPPIVFESFCTVLPVIIST